MVHPVPPDSKQTYTFTTPTQPKQRLSQTPRFSDCVFFSDSRSDRYNQIIYIGGRAAVLDPTKFLLYTIICLPYIHTIRTYIHTYHIGLCLPSLPCVPCLPNAPIRSSIAPKRIQTFQTASRRSETFPDTFKRSQHAIMPMLTQIPYVHMGLCLAYIPYHTIWDCAYQPA